MTTARRTVNFGDPADVAPAPPNVAAAAPVPTSPATPAPPRRSEPAHHKAKMSAEIDTPVAEAARNAFTALPRGLHATFAGYVTEALRRYTNDLEARYNDGAPFPERHTINLTPGRRAD